MTTLANGFAAAVQPPSAQSTITTDMQGLAAGDAFYADYRPSYRKEAAQDGWQRALAWFSAHGVG